MFELLQSSINTIIFPLPTGEMQLVEDSPTAAQKNKRLRTAFTATQLRALEYTFRMCPYPDSYGREQIARATAISEAKIQVAMLAGVATSAWYTT